MKYLKLPKNALSLEYNATSSRAVDRAIKFHGGKVYPGIADSAEVRFGKDKLILVDDFGDRGLIAATRAERKILKKIKNKARSFGG